MRILVTGATGFIGSAIVAALRRSAHDVVLCVHRTGHRYLPADAETIEVDYMRDLTAEDWLPRLAGVDVVINAVGILRESAQARFSELHHLAPRALFQACERSGVNRVVQISALGADEGASQYHRTKRAADDVLRVSTLDWTIVQPSVVFGSRGASTRLFLRLASLPVIPLVGRGEQRMQPVHIDDLVTIVAKLIEHRLAVKQTIAVVGPEAVAMQKMLSVYRGLLGLGKTFMIPIPLALIRPVARVGDVLKSGALSTETLHMLLNGNTGSVQATHEILGYFPRALQDFIPPEEAEFLRMNAVWSWVHPMLLAGIAIMWAAAGVVSWIYARDHGLALLVKLGLSPEFATGAFIVACGVNVALGIATLLTPGKILWVAQLAVMGFYTAVLSWVAPQLWVDPFGALIKNLPIAAVLLGFMAASAEA
ncbi:NAD-dependent dehydratase [Sulfuricaulis limicola]|uniref:NAD-dependent dehydratase n=1 Tax=Sulfuricaulis limicola TaxID=1620215 RepID=A0A1B4XJD4_9GAMM|nr:SDR family oxidoreductase [Sulfuricaulis limicola]BAV34916.1 NAD-dependent dehydratase [Sulfuricaulis limicola]